MYTLVIEDNVVFQKWLDKTIAESEFLDSEVKVTRTLEDGMKVLESADVDVILLDLNLPDSNGLGTFSEVFARASTVPIIVVSAIEDLETSKKALNMGAQDYIVKNKFDDEMLVRSIRYAIERYRAQIDINRANQDLSNALTEVRAKEQQLVQQERLRALGQMASGVAHDFNNALQPIMLAANLIEEDNKILEQPETLKDYIGEILESTRVAAETVNRLTRFYRADTTREKSVVDLSELVKNATELTRPKWKQEAYNQGVTVELQTELGEDCLVYGLNEEFREMIVNLVFNSVEAITENGNITVQTEKRGEWVHLEISDTGCGMSEEIRHRCMEPFYTTKDQRGSGLGLSIIYGVVQRHDGEINVDSEENVGTTVSISLPRVEREKEKPASATSKLESFSRGTEPYRILVVDDEPPLLKLLKRLLERIGHDVVAAVSGQQAWKQFNETEFDIVITDRAMPGMTGEQLASLLKEKKPDLPVIMLSGFGELMKERGESFEAVDMIIGKPVSLRELQQAIARMLDV